MKTKDNVHNGTVSKPRKAIDDFYWQAVPLDEILEAAERRRQECGAVTEVELHSCATDEVKVMLCTCASDLQNVVDTVVDVFCDKVREQQGAPKTGVDMSQEHADKQRGTIESAMAIPLSTLADYAESSTVSRIIAKNSAGNVTLFSFDAGQSLSEHSTSFDALVQVIDGEVELTIGGKRVIAQTGEVVLMPANVPHAVYAVKQFKMLLTMLKGT